MFFMLNSAEHKFILLMNVKMPKMDILTFMSRINTALCSLFLRDPVFQIISRSQQLLLFLYGVGNTSPRASI